MIVEGKVQTPSVGTDRWCAPEVLHGGEQTAMRDVWALGCIYMEMVCRFMPWVIQELGDLEKPLPEKGIRPWVTQQLLKGNRPYPEFCLESVDKVIARCMKVEAAERPAPREIREHFAHVAAVKMLAANSADRNNLYAVCQSVRKNAHKMESTEQCNEVFRKLCQLKLPAFTDAGE